MPAGSGGGAVARAGRGAWTGSRRRRRRLVARGPVRRTGAAARQAARLHCRV